MKATLTYLFALIAAVVAGTTCLASAKSTCNKPVSGFGFLNSSTDTPPSLANYIILSQREDSMPRAPQDEAEIQKAPDIAMNASAIPAMDAILCLIAVLCWSRTKLHASMVRPPQQQSLLRLLFRTIIAPNAP
jgi:hypothetical protein